jgi:hypothetical protein
MCTPICFDSDLDTVAENVALLPHVKMRAKGDSLLPIPSPPKGPVPPARPKSPVPPVASAMLPLPMAIAMSPVPEVAV